MPEVEDQPNDDDELARRLAALLAGAPDPEALRERLLADAALAPLLAALAGREVQAGQTVLTFGAGTQTGNVQIRDVAGGNIVTFNIYYDTPRAEPSVAPPPASESARPAVPPAGIAEPSPPAAGSPVQPEPIAAQPPPATEPSAQPAPDRGDLPRLWQHARVAYNTRQWAEAAALLTRVAGLDPNYQDVQARLAEARRQLDLERRYAALATLREQDRWEELLDRWAELTAQAREYPDPQGHRAWAEGRRRREQWLEAALLAVEQAAWDEAITELEALLAEFPADAEALPLLERARAEQAAAEQRQREEAARRQAAAEQRQREKAARRQAAAEQRQREEAARRERERYGSVPALLQAGSFDQAVTALEETLTETPADREAASLVAQIIETPAAPVAVRLRAAALAGRVGDPRFPVTMAQWRAELARRNRTFGQPEGYFCYLPAGTYRIGGWDDAKQAAPVTLSPFWIARYVPTGTYRIGGWDDARHAASVTLPVFWIARYPLTVAQYKPFVAVGYGPGAERWWTPQGWKWKQAEKRTQPWGWGESPYNAPSQPVIGVTWYEAAAFCAWLSEQLGDALPAGYVVRLPTEAEWEAAAAHDGAGQRRLYPWGSREPTPELAIYNASGLRRPAPVGCCPAGAAACGALDLAGNVWEWTASSYAGYPAQSWVLVKDFTVGQLDAPVRGGSWDSTYVRCLAQAGRHPEIGGNDRGFRVVVSPLLAQKF